MRIRRIALLALCISLLTGCENVTVTSSPKAQVKAGPAPTAKKLLVSEPTALTSYAYAMLLEGDRVDIQFDVVKPAVDGRTVSGIKLRDGKSSLAIDNVKKVNEREVAGYTVTRYQVSVGYADIDGSHTFTLVELSLNDGEKSACGLGRWQLDKSSLKYSQTGLYVKNAVSVSSRAFANYYLGVAKQRGSISKREADSLSLSFAGVENARIVQREVKDDVATLMVEKWNTKDKAAAVTTVYPVLSIDMDGTRQYIKVESSSIYGVPINTEQDIKALIE